MSKYKNELLLLLSTIAYGVSYPVCKYVQGYMNTSPFMGLRGVLGFLTVAVWYFLGCRKNPERLSALKNRKMHVYALICSGIGGTGMYLSMYALNYTMASKASFLTCTYVLMMPIVSFVFFKGKSSVDQLAALLAATGGMALISGVVSTSGVSLSEINKGDLMTLTAAVIIAFQAVYLNWFSKKLEYDVEAFTMVQMFFTAVVYIVVWQLTQPGQGLSFDTPLVVLSTVYVGVGVAGFGFLAFNGPVKQLPPARSAIILATEPIFGAVGAYVIRDRWGHNEVLTPLQMLGCAVVLAAVLGSELYSQRGARREV
ncbi:MAG TPA: DMT family transporter [Terriglobales bacterium]|nr:DMT family transporter [Terriglobales bacterium]